MQPPAAPPAVTAPAVRPVVADSGPVALAPGVSYRRVVRAEGPWVLHVLTVALGTPGVRVESARAFGRAAGRERTTAMAARWCAPGRRAAAAVNADLFSMRTGDTEGVLVAGGEVLHAARAAESPWDGGNRAHSALAVTADGRAAVARVAFAGWLAAGGRQAPLDGVNAAGLYAGRAHGAVLFTPAWGRVTPRWGDPARGDTAGARLEVAFRTAVRHGDTLDLRDPRPGAPGGGTAVPRRGAVLSAAAGAPAAALLRASAPNASPNGVPNARGATGVGAAPRVRAVLRVAPAPPGGGGWYTVAGGWGRLLAGGADVHAAADREEGTFPAFSARRHPRTAAALTAASDTLLLVVADGRTAASAGMTFGELAAALRALGAADAVNLDGGGSATAAVSGAPGRARVVNRPSDREGERPVGSAVLVTVPAAGRRCPAAPSAPRGGWNVVDPDAPPTVSPRPRPGPPARPSAAAAP